ncbi:MAG: tRNA dihydrouridine synthase DusB [Verrucomicrobiota bacterium]
MLPWFQDRFPLYLAPMAGITDTTFRQLCKGYGADVMVSEFVSSEGIFRKNERTMEYLDFEESERPLGIQLFGGDPDHLAEAAKIVLDWKRPDFLDINFGCPVNKVVSKNGGSSILRDCPLLARIAGAIVKAVAPHPVTAKIRIGWSADTINATTTARILEDCGIQAVAVHGRTKEQGYSGEADWNVIAQVAEAVRIPVIGNGDIVTAHDVEHRKSTTLIAGIMIGRTAMQHPWVFREIRHYLDTGTHLAPPSLAEIWAHIRRHCAMEIARQKLQPRGLEAPGSAELHAMQSMRTQLMSYSRGMSSARQLREKFAHVASLAQLDDIAAENIAQHPSDSHLAAA